MTPEGKVKEKIKRFLNSLEVPMYYHMPVQNGMGAPTLDFICSIAGRYVAIEAKRPGEWLTPRQQHTCAQIEKAGGAWFCIDDSPQSWETINLYLRYLTCPP